MPTCSSRTAGRVQKMWEGNLGCYAEKSECSLHLPAAVVKAGRVQMVVNDCFTIDWLPRHGQDQVLLPLLVALSELAECRR